MGRSIAVLKCAADLLGFREDVLEDAACLAVLRDDA
jgi:hypothetical protein